MPFEDPYDVQDPTAGEDILAAYGDALRNGILVALAAPTARVQRGTIQSVTDDTNTGIEADSVLYDSHSIHSVVGGISRFTVPAGWDGEWQFEVSTNWQANNIGKRSVFIRLNGTLVIDGVTAPCGFDGYMQQNLVTSWQAVEDDYVEFFVNQDCGAGLNLEPLDYAFQTMRARWVRLPSSVEAA